MAEYLLAPKGGRIRCGLAAARASGSARRSERVAACLTHGFVGQPPWIDLVLGQRDRAPCSPNPQEATRWPSSF